MKIKIDGIEYELPGMDTITLDESIVLFEETGMTLDKIDQLEGFDPGFTKGLLRIAVHRARPDLGKREVAKRIGELLLENLLEAFGEDEDEDTDARPPETEPEPERSDETSGDDSNATSPKDPPEQPGHPFTGGHGSDNTESDRLRSVS